MLVDNRMLFRFHAIDGGGDHIGESDNRLQVLIAEFCSF
jgi:hypothetical protein